MVVWGGSASNDYFRTGGKYNPVANTWSKTSTKGAPAPRELHTAIWTGSEMVIWGGDDGEFATYYNSGGRYRP